MDNYDLSNFLLLGHCADAGEQQPWLMDEENRRATFSRRSPTVSTTEQAEQQLPLTSDEQIFGQKLLADFDISLSPNILDSLIADESEDPFAALASYASSAAYNYQLLSFDDDTGQPLNSNLGLFGNINTSSEAVLAELEGNDVEQPEQSHGESDTQGIIIPEITIPDTVSDKRSGKRRAPEQRNVVIGDLPESSIEHSIDMHIMQSLRGSQRLTERRQKLDSTETEIVPLPQENRDNSLRERVERETEKWIVVRKGGRKRFRCNYPICGFASTRIGDLKKHIFTHTRFSIFKCAYPECAHSPYFRDIAQLRRHEQIYHTYEQPHYCSLCDEHFERLENYKTHIRTLHNIDNCILPNLPLLKDSGEHPHWLTAEQNKQATFSRRSATAGTLEQQTVDEPENPFAALATHQPLTFDDDSQQPLDSNLGLVGDINTSEAVLAEPEGNDVSGPKQPEQPQSESDAQGIIIPESTIEVNVSDKRLGKRRASALREVIMRGIPKSSIEHSIEMHFRKSLCRSERLTKTRQKLDSTETEMVPLPQGVVTRGQSVVMPEKSANSPKNTGQDTGESLSDLVKRETKKWTVRLERGAERRYVCNYPNCGSAYTSSTHLKVHIFKHIGISVYKCTNPECSDNPYFSGPTALQRHIQTQHTHEEPYRCALCDRRFGRQDNYKRHMFKVHKLRL